MILCKSLNNLLHRTYAISVAQVAVKVDGSVLAVGFESGCVVFAPVRKPYTTLLHRNKIYVVHAKIKGLNILLLCSRHAVLVQQNTMANVNQHCCNFMIGDTNIIYQRMGMFSVNTKVQTMDDQCFLLHVGHYSCKFANICNEQNN